MTVRRHDIMMEAPHERELLTLSANYDNEYIA